MVISKNEKTGRVEVRNDREYAVGDTVFWADGEGRLLNGTVSHIYSGILYIEIQGSDAACPGPVKEKLIGSYIDMDPCKCWPSRQEWRKASIHQERMQVQSYYESITDIEGLVGFLYAHDVSPLSGHCDLAAQEAAARRAKELLGITLPIGM